MVPHIFLHTFGSFHCVQSFGDVYKLNILVHLVGEVFEIKSLDNSIYECSSTTQRCLWLYHQWIDTAAADAAIQEDYCHSSPFLAASLRRTGHILLSMWRLLWLAFRLYEHMSYISEQQQQYQVLSTAVSTVVRALLRALLRVVDCCLSREGFPPCM